MSVCFTVEDCDTHMHASSISSLLASPFPSSSNRANAMCAVSAFGKNCDMFWGRSVLLPSLTKE
jgi:hypothetical protein